LIKKPTSLNTVTKKTRGHQQRGAATGISDFKTWDAFEEEVAYIWNNARTYNEDGSDMFILASQFEVGLHKIRVFNNTDSYYRKLSRSDMPM